VIAAVDGDMIAIVHRYAHAYYWRHGIVHRSTWSAEDLKQEILTDLVREGANGILGRAHRERLRHRTIDAIRRLDGHRCDRNGLHPTFIRHDEIAFVLDAEHPPRERDEYDCPLDALQQFEAQRAESAAACAIEKRRNAAARKRKSRALERARREGE